MTTFEGIKAYISANATLAAKLTGGINAQIIPQGSKVFPLLVVKLVSAMSLPPTHDEGASDWIKCRFELTTWSTNLKEAEQTAILLKALFRPIMNNFLGGANNVQFSCTGTAGPRSLQDEVTKLLGVQIDILGYIKEATLS